MKTNSIIFALGFLSSFATAQTLKEKDVPANVVQAFQKEFPGTKVEKWEKEGGNYEAEFDRNKIETSVVYDANGNKIEQEVELKTSELPKSVLEYFEKNMPGKKIDEASKIIAADGRVTYEVEVGDTEYRFADDVGLIMQKKETEDKDEKD